MLACIDYDKRRNVVSVLDTDDFVVENIALIQVAKAIQSGLKVHGIYQNGYVKPVTDLPDLLSLEDNFIERENFMMSFKTGCMYKGEKCTLINLWYNGYYFEIKSLLRGLDSLILVNDKRVFLSSYHVYDLLGTFGLYSDCNFRIRLRCSTSYSTDFRSFVFNDEGVLVGQGVHEVSNAVGIPLDRSSFKRIVFQKQLRGV